MELLLGLVIGVSSLSGHIKAINSFKQQLFIQALATCIHASWNNLPDYLIDIKSVDTLYDSIADFMYLITEPYLLSLASYIAIS